VGLAMGCSGSVLFAVFVGAWKVYLRMATALDSSTLELQHSNKQQAIHLQGLNDKTLEVVQANTAAMNQMSAGMKEVGDGLRSLEGRMTEVEGGLDHVRDEIRNRK